MFMPTIKKSSPKKKTKSKKRKMLGTGMAGKAADALKARKKKLKQAMKKQGIR